MIDMGAGTEVQLKNRLGGSISELIGQYELSNIADGKSPKTVRWYSEMLQSFAGFFKEKTGGIDISGLSVGLVRDYVCYLRNRCKFQGHPYTPEQSQLLSPRTVQCHVRVLKAFSSWLYYEGYSEENRLKNLKLPKAPSKIIEPLTPEEIEVVNAAIDKDAPTGSRNHVIFVTILDTGLRSSEAADVTLGRLNLEAGFIKVMGKGAKERIVPIGSFVRRILWDYLVKVRSEPADRNCDNLFLSPSGRPITANTIKLIFARLAKRSGVERLHAHLCRHTFAVNYLLNGGDIFSLQQILGHTTLDMVRHYLHFTSSQITVLQHKYSPMDRLYKAALENN